MMKKLIEGGITAAKGFQATGNAIGIKNGVKDLAMIESVVPATAAAAFTTNIVKATSVQRNMEIIKKQNKIRGIVINSGNANACTGEEGVKANAEMAHAYAQLLKVADDMVFTASTGVIGATFPIEIIKKGIQNIFPNLGEKREDALLAAEAIMTTDTYSKEIAVEIELSGKIVRIGGMAKGSGMIHPNMATMLAFVTTDANIERTLLDKLLKEDIQSTYNMVSVDGDTSTNDTIIVLANGLAENECITEENEDYIVFKEALHFINEHLAKELVKDGEGATKLVEVNVEGAESKENAKQIAKSVITSSLVKAAMFGEDANWGRVLCAMGYSGVKFDTTKVDIIYKSAKGRIELMKQGTPIVFDEEKAAKILSENKIIVDIVLQEGTQKATAWGCDLSYDYVKINGDYRS